VIFTEQRDTPNYLRDRIQVLLGRPESVVTIHGGMGREERRKAQEAFTQDKTVEILLATDAAGEGISLQRAHLRMNYDIPSRAFATSAGCPIAGGAGCFLTVAISSPRHHPQRPSLLLAKPPSGDVPIATGRCRWLNG
jgi:Helicase conserved C-terminal domain